MQSYQRLSLTGYAFSCLLPRTIRSLSKAPTPVPPNPQLITMPSSALSFTLSKTPPDRRFHTIYQPTERVEAYRPTGYHPVHFGDLLHGQYQIIRKLGYGAFSTVWLARDIRHLRYVALKVKTAQDSIENAELSIMNHLSHSKSHSKSAHVVTLLDSFHHSGPNGTHLCLVLEAMGASVAAMMEELSQNKPKRFGHVSRYPKWMAKRILTHMLRGIAFLHSRGITHGDIQPGNLLFSASALDSVSVEELEDDENGAVEPVERLDGKPDKWAPRYLAISDPLFDYTDLDPGFTVKISDLGAACISDNVSKNPVTPVALRAPELILQAPYDHSIDIWSFGCLAYEFLTGTPLFPIGGQNTPNRDDDHLLRMTDTLGPLPQSLTARWPRSSRYFRLNGDLFNTMISGPPGINRFGSLETRFGEQKSDEMADDEARLVMDLLRSVLRYEPGERPSAEQVLRHTWFQIIF